MKQTITFLILLSINLFAFDNVSINLNFETYNGSKFNNIVKFGIYKNATNGYDSELNETDIPGHPPGNLHAFMKFYDDKQQSNINSYLDYRAIPNKDTFHIRYLVSVRFESNDTLTVSWNNIKNITKASFQDKFDGMFYDIDMLNQESVTIGNSAFDEFYIDVYYDKFTSIIENDEFDEIFQVFPNPFYDEINLTNQNMINKIELYDINGKIIANDFLQNKNMNSGVYYLKIYDLNGKTHIKKIIKGY